MKFVSMFLVIALMGLVGCQPDVPAERAGERLDKAMGNKDGDPAQMREKLDKAVDEAQKKTEDIANEVDDAADDVAR